MLPREEAPELILPPPRGVDALCCCFSLVGVYRDDLVLASVLLCSTSLPLSSTTAGRVGFRPLLGLVGATSSVEAAEPALDSCLASSFSTSTSSVSLSSGLTANLFLLPRRVSADDDDVADVVEGDDTAGMLLVFVSLELFRELASESSSSLSVSFLLEVRLLCLLSAGDPVREPLDVTEEGVPALELSFGPLEFRSTALVVVSDGGAAAVLSAIFFRGVTFPTGPAPAPDLGPGFFLSKGFVSTTVATGSGSVWPGSSFGAGSTSGNSLSLVQDKFSLIFDLLIHSS